MKMKKVLFSVATISLLIACGESQKPTTVETKTIPIDNIAEKQVEKVCKKGYDKKATKIAFGGFKTTQKVEVKGYFKKFTIDSTNVADSPEEIFANSTISIPTDYIETNDIGRNRRLREEYFGKMEATQKITGKIIEFDKESSQVKIELTINAVSNIESFDYKLVGDTLTLNGTIDILNFDGSSALKAINKACEVLHKGADGISKTWSEANIYISTVIKETCE
jgi:polyisoprenoid-binding protein YceI